MVQSPLISIITSCFNSAPFLKRTIESVLSQTYIYFEWILVNDGSDDDTETIVNMYKDSRIRYFKQENKGQCNALNFGIGKAIGYYIKFLDADDYLNVEHLESLVARINELPENERYNKLYLCKWLRFSGINNIWEADKRLEWGDYTPLSFIEKALGNGPDMLPAWQWLVPKLIIDNAGGWNDDLGLGNDFEFSIRLILASEKIIFCESAIVYYRSDFKNNMSSNTSIETITSVLMASRIGISHLLSRSQTPEIIRICAEKMHTWLITYYPYIDNQTVKIVEKEIKYYGGSTNFYGWGSKMVFLKKIIGWKLTRLIQFYYYKIRY